MIEFAVYVFLVACLAGFIRTLMGKWGILGWLQMNAPSEFWHTLFTCEFCQSFWIGMAISLALCISVHWWLIFVPFFSSVLRW